LLRGEARGKRFASFSKKRGEVFVSGDYENATDNLSLHLAGRILSRILSRCRHVPVSLREYALRSLVAAIEYPGGRVVVQRRGQLMGNYLSFPLLCLQNYLAFRFLVPRSVPVRINGDDIVFRCRPAEYRRWAEGVGALGLTLCKGKTLVDKSFFSLNSAFFQAQLHRVREIPVVRGASLLRNEWVPSGGPFVRFTRGWKGDARRLVGALWLRAHGASIRATGRSVEGLGIPADNSQLHTAGLSVREAFYRGSKSFLRLPESRVPQVPQGRAVRLHEEWVKYNGPTMTTPSQERSWLSEFRSRCHHEVWQPHGPRVEPDNEVRWID
jgi:hypothetical protein